MGKDQCPAIAPIFGFMGCAASIVLASKFSLFGQSGKMNYKSSSIDLLFFKKCEVLYLRC